MARPRLVVTPRAGRQNGRPARPQTPSNQMNSVIQALVPAMAALNQRPPNPRVPSSEAQEKCKLEMSFGDFKAWRCSMEWWLSLNQWEPSDAVCHIRLCCAPTLQRAMDARYSVAQWSILTPGETLDAIKRIVLQPTNRAANWSHFFSDHQKKSERVSTI